MVAVNRGEVPPRRNIKRRLLSPAAVLITRMFGLLVLIVTLASACGTAFSKVSSIDSINGVHDARTF